MAEPLNESAPLAPTASSSPYFSVNTASKTFGTPYFLLSTAIASIIPIIQLIIGLHYKGQCPIDQRIPTYMIVAGICGLALVALSVLLALTFMCFISDSAALTAFAGCGICFNVMASVILSIFVFIWFICGCVWVFGVHSRVQYEIPLFPDYCQPVLYKATVAFLIITIIWAVIQCCVSCFRSCCTGQSQQ